MDQPTPRPWQRVNNAVYDTDYRPTEYEGRSRFGPYANLLGRMASEADAEHIVNCVNLHEELVETLRKVYDVVGWINSTNVTVSADSISPTDFLVTAQDTLRELDALLTKLDTKGTV